MFEVKFKHLQAADGRAIYNCNILCTNLWQNERNYNFLNSVSIKRFGEKKMIWKLTNSRDD